MGQGWKRSCCIALLLALLAGLLPVRAVAAGSPGLGAQILEEAGCYYGDPSACVMTRDQAAAFAAVIDQALAENSGRSTYKAAIFDAGDGIPALWLVMYDPPMVDVSAYNVIWEWDGTRAVPSSFTGTCSAVVYDDGVIFGQYGYAAIGGMIWKNEGFFPFEHGRISSRSTAAEAWVDSTNPKGQRPTLEETKQAVERIEESYQGEPVTWWMSGLNYDYSGVEWEWVESGMDGSYWRGQITDSTGLLNRSTEEQGPGVYMGACSGSWSDPRTVAELLSSYAQSAGRPAYTLPELGADAADYQAVTDAALAQIAGEVTGVYRLAEGIYYVLVETGEGLVGAVVRGIREGGSAVWRVDERQDQPLDSDGLKALSNQLQTTPNLTLDYTRLEGNPTLEGLRTYLNELLDNMDGLTPNDPAKSELAVFLAQAVSALSSGRTSAGDNRLSLGAQEVSQLAGQADSARSALLEVLEEAGVTLNQPVVPAARLLWQDPNLDQPCQITLEADLAQGLGDTALQLLLGDGQHALQMTPDQLNTLHEAYPTWSIQIQRQEEGSYALRFLDGNGQVVDQLPAPITVTLPATGPLNTIMVTYAGGSDNWGGQYDPAAGTITFETEYSGQYQVLENQVEIDDIGHLPEDVQQAIAFLVSRGYLELDGTSFHPDDPLSRYAFTQSLVGMFFALDRELTTTFTDVPAESSYYPYVASAQVKGIVTGVSETVFSGESDLTVEQMLALAARTLMDHKGYIPPSDGEAYLTSFEDSGQISSWAREAVALAVREELVDLGGALNPTAPVSRAQAADILYRLFLLLYQVSPVALELPASDSAQQANLPSWLPIALGAFGVVALAGSGTAAAILLKKRYH